MSLPSVEKPTQYQTMMMGVHPDARLPVFPVVDENGRKLGPHRCAFEKTDYLNFDLYITDKFMFDPEVDSAQAVSGCDLFLI